jgi:hypothetical protein
VVGTGGRVVVLLSTFGHSRTPLVIMMGMRQVLIADVSVVHLVAPTNAAGAVAANGRRRRCAAPDRAKRANDARAGVGEAYDLVAPSSPLGVWATPLWACAMPWWTSRHPVGRHCNWLQLQLCALWFEGCRAIDFAAMDDAASMVCCNLQVARVRL